MSIVKVSKGDNSRKMQMELQFLFSAYCQMMLYICTRLHETIFRGFKVIQQVEFAY